MDTVYIKERSPIKAPVIAGSLKRPAEEALVDYIEQLRKIPALKIVIEEGDRLMPVFEGLSRRLHVPQEQGPPDLSNLTIHTWHRQENQAPAPNFLTAGVLSAMFAKIGIDTRNTILSEMAIIPFDALEGPVMRALKDQGNVKEFRKDRDHLGNKYTLGFIQCRKDVRVVSHAHDVSGSVSFPVVALWPEGLKAIERFKPERLLRDLQAIATDCNHDSLHHFTSFRLNGNIAGHYQRPDYVSDADDKMIARFRNFGDQDPRGYESWAIMSHAGSWAAAQDTPAAETLSQSVDSYFDELQRISVEMLAAGLHDKKECHRIIDYFSTFAGFMLMRIYPFDHPVMEKCIKRMKDVDPAPELVAHEYAKDFCKYNDAIVAALSVMRTEDVVKVYLDLKAQKEPAKPKSFFDFISKGKSLHELLNFYSDSKKDNKIPKNDSLKEDHTYQYLVLDDCDEAHYLNRLRKISDRGFDASAPEACQEDQFREALAKDIVIVRWKEGLDFSQGEITRLMTSAIVCASFVGKFAHQETRDAVRSYEAKGFKIVDPLDAEHSYETLKRLQLMDLAPEIALLVAPDAGRAHMATLTKRGIDAVDNEIFGALAKGMGLLKKPAAP